MKTTIDIPEPVYKRAKIRAVEQGATLRDLVLRALERELGQPQVAESRAPYFARRSLTPEFKALEESGALQGGTDATLAISDSRNREVS